MKWYGWLFWHGPFARRQAITAIIGTADHLLS